MLWAGGSGDRIPVGGEIFRSRPDRPWGPPSLLYNWYRVSFPGVKRSGRGVDHPPPSSAEVKERVELYLYSPSRPSWPVLGRTLPFYLFLPLQGHKQLHLHVCSKGLWPGTPAARCTTLEFWHNLPFFLVFTNLSNETEFLQKIITLIKQQPCYCLVQHCSLKNLVTFH
jgi:hypothetical protein